VSDPNETPPDSLPDLIRRLAGLLQTTPDVIAGALNTIVEPPGRPSGGARSRPRPRVAIDGEGEH
jgi:hypothetical protein